MRTNRINLLKNVHCFSVCKVSNKNYKLVVVKFSLPTIWLLNEWLHGCVIPFSFQRELADERSMRRKKKREKRERTIANNPPEISRLAQLAKATYITTRVIAQQAATFRPKLESNKRRFQPASPFHSSLFSSIFKHPCHRVVHRFENKIVRYYVTIQISRVYDLCSSISLARNVASHEAKRRKKRNTSR